MTKILVTGSSGFIGTELVNYLSDKHQIIEFDLSNGKDILNLKRLKEYLQGCEIVVHLAAHRKPYEDKTFQEYWETNCQGTLNVAQAAVECGVKKFIYSSSTSYFGIEKGIPSPKSLKINSPTMTQYVKVEDIDCGDCDIAYSTSKVIAEQILANFGLTKKMQVIILRLGPTRKKGEYLPFGELKLHLKIENALQIIDSAINTDKELWYESFTVTDENKYVDLSKSKNILDYRPI